MSTRRRLTPQVAIACLVLRRYPRLFLAVAGAALLVLQGCATQGISGTQTVWVETPGCERASCDLSNDRGSWNLPRTPGEVALAASLEPLKVSCRASDDPRVNAGALVSLPAVTGAGAVAGGVVGGAAVGASVGTTALSFIPVVGVLAVLTGAALGAAAGHVVESVQTPIHYPKLISVSMQCPQAGTTGASTN